MAGGNYIKLDRKLLDWEWYKNPNTFRVFLHCLLRANWKDLRSEGYDVPRGSFVTSLTSLSEELELSVKQIRTALEHLKGTGEVAVKKTPKFSIITVQNYCQYQALGIAGAEEGHSKGRQGATSKEGKKVRRKEGSKEGQNTTHISLKTYNDLVDRFGRQFVDERAKRAYTDEALIQFCEADKSKAFKGNFENHRQYNFNEIEKKLLEVNKEE